MFDANETYVLMAVLFAFTCSIYAEVARSLPMGALERARREELYRRVAEAYTSKLRARDLKIFRAFERLDG